MVLDSLADQAGKHFTNAPKVLSQVCKYDDFLLCKPQTFMNNSGQAVRAVLEYYNQAPSSDNLNEVYVVHDDLDLELGSYKLQMGTGPKAHNGLLSIYQHLGTKEFWHVRGGVDNRGELRSKITPAEYVLQPFTPEERPVVTQEIAAIVAELSTNV